MSKECRKEEKGAGQQAHSLWPWKVLEGRIWVIGAQSTMTPATYEIYTSLRVQDVCPALG